MDNDIIKLKGTGDGVKIYLSEDAPFQKILETLQEKLRAWRSFFGTGHCNMYFSGRALDKSDTLRLEAVVKAMLSEAVIIYGDKKTTAAINVKIKEEEKEEIKIADREASSNEYDSGADKVRDELINIQEVVTTNFKSSRARLYEGNVKAGRVVESDGHLILVGDVLEGGKLISNGNVIVLGSVMGSIEAGCVGNRDAYIIALDMKPYELRIAHSITKFDGSEECLGGKKIARLINNEILCEDFFVKNIDKAEKI